MTRLLLLLPLIAALTLSASCTSSVDGKAIERRDSVVISSATLKSLLGKNLGSEEVAAFFRNFSRSPEVTGIPGPYVDRATYYSWKENGISLMLTSGQVATIFLYAGNSEGFSRYKGEIPDGLQFSDSRESIENKWGAPEVSGGNGIIRFWASYPNRGIGITYEALDPNDRSTTIRHISIKRPKSI